MSPDGKRVAYLRTFDGRTDVWITRIDGGNTYQLTGQTTPQGADPGQRQAYPLAWTPDSQTVMFASTNEGKLWAVPADGGPSTVIDEAAGNHHSPEVSPDGTQVAYVAEREEVVDIFVASLDGTSVRQISPKSEDAYVANPHWSPDGTQLIWMQWPHYDMPWDQIEIVISDVQTGARTTVASGERVANNWASWLPDSSAIVYASDRGSDFYNLWKVHPDGTGAEQLADGKRDHFRPAVSPDGTKIAALRLDACEHQVCVWNRGEIAQVSVVTGVYSDLQWIDNHRMLCVFESPAQPPDLHILDTADGSLEQITFSATGAVHSAVTVEPEIITWESDDGLAIEGLLFEPEDIRQGQHPLVVFIHGGPVGQSTRNWAPWLQYLVQQGYVVLVPNYRGSRGYGRPFMEALYGDWGGGELRDIVAGVEAVIARGNVNASRVVATGGSAGGYSTLICMTKAPQIFKAGIARFGIADLKTFYYRTWIFERYYIAKLMGGTGGQVPEMYEDRSPINFVDDVTSPLLILQGDIDIVCHRSEMDRMTAALEKAGKQVEYTVYEGEGHGWKKISSIVDDARQSDDFLNRMVLNS